MADQMPKASESPDVFFEQIREIVEKVNDAINAYIDKIAGFINEHATEIGVLLGAGAGSMAGPLGTIGGGIIGGFTGAGLEGKFDEFVDRIQAFWKTTQEQIWTGIGDVLGDPMTMSAASADYKKAVASLGDVKGKVEGADRYVSNAWTGLAATGYSNTSERQKKALQGMSDMLGDAANLLDDNQEKLLANWNKQIFNVWGLYLAAGEAGIGMVEIENALTGGVKGVLELIVKVGDEVGKIVQEAIDYWIALNVGSAGDWDSLQSKFGDRGLIGRSWPDIDSIDQGPINGPWQTAS